ncbi:TPR repeat-containing protein [Methanocaldococcus sp. FS406-22]|uniref:tetratricopeptide repeat protein n=1 Tax=Methanocaldococcus sp. (strain FS406-22) TaxID=644281 RepID=UPI0001BF576A|nr:tetratricopeptide repeat protein [Methanocaldococcus sp. FS406-22]ADC69419.1 TPR repeat-containing protein [Methanocaldococcus sp. FS406-22]
MSWEDFVEKGEEYIEKGDYDKAIECFERALDECPEEGKWITLKCLALCYRLKENYDKAIEYFKKALEKCPKDKKWEILEDLGVCYYSKGEYGRAIEYFEKALELCPDEEKWRIWISLGDCYYNIRDYDKAIDYYKKALKMCPEDKKWIIFISLGGCYCLKKDYNEAIKYHKALLSYSEKNYDKVFEYLNEMLKICPDREKWRILVGLGFCCYIKGDYDKAIDYSKKALEPCPDEEKWRIWCILGACHYLKGNYDKVIKCFDELLEYSKKYPKVKENIEKDIIFLTYRYLKEELNDKEKIEKNFKIIIRIIEEIHKFKEKLKVKYDENTVIAHYTKPETIISILKAKYDKKEDKKPYFRLYNACYMNDPEEGKTFLRMIIENKLRNLKKAYEIKEIKDEKGKIRDIIIEENPEFQTFIGSFIVGNEEDIDKLFFWRTYGKDSENEEAKGICICIKKEFFDQDSDNLPNYLENIKPKTVTNFTDDVNSNKTNKETSTDDEKFCLYKVIYEDTKDYKKLKKVLRNINKYAKDLDLDDETIRNLLKSLLDDLRYLVKSKHYKEEKEYRIIKTYNINYKRDKIKIDYTKTPPRLYIEIEKDFIEYIDEIILGPRMENKEAWKTYLSYHKIKVRESNCKFK